MVVVIITEPKKANISNDYVAGFNKNLQAIDNIAVTKTNWLADSECCEIYFDVMNNQAIESLKELLQNERQAQNSDFALLPQENRKKQLLLSDMDSTIIAQECIDELAGFVGIGAEVSKITESAMQGEIGFKESLEQRIGLLKGLEKSVLEKVYKTKIHINSGAKTLVQTMKSHDAKTILVSGGFTYFTNKISEVTGFDENYANELMFNDDILSGKVALPVLDKNSKLEILNKQCELLGISSDDAIAVGDGANDLPMIKAASIGVSYHGKQIVQQNSDVVINNADLTALLYIQGYTKQEFIL